MEWIKRNLLFSRSKSIKKEEIAKENARASNDTDEFVDIVGEEKVESTDSGSGISCILSDSEEHVNNSDNTYNSINVPDNVDTGYIPQPQTPSKSSSNHSPQSKSKHAKPLIYSQSTTPQQTSVSKKKSANHPQPQLRTCIIHQPK